MYNVVHENTTRNVMVALMEFFTRFQIERYGSVIEGVNGTYITRKVIRVPIQFAARDKWMEIYRSSSARKAMDPAIREKNPAEMQWILPRISFNIAGIIYDSTRRLQKTQRIGTNVNTSTATMNNAYTPASYNIDIEVAVISKRIDDQLQLMEQILPFFAPTMNMDVKVFANRPAESVPYNLNSVMQDIPTDLGENDERLFTFTYLFTVKLNYYIQPPISMLNGPSILLNGTGVPSNNLGETGFWYLQGAILGTPTISACHDVATFYVKGANAWKSIWTAPSSGGWIVKNTPPTSADTFFLPCGEPVTAGDWTYGTTPPPSAAEPANLYFYDTHNGKAYRKYCTWTYRPDAPPAPVSGDFMPTNWYVDTVTGWYYEKVCAWQVVREGLSSASRLIMWTQSNVHMATDYVAVTDEWLEEQQRIQRRFEYFEETASNPNPFITVWPNADQNGIEYDSIDDDVIN